MDQFWSTVVAIAMGVIGLAIVATVIGKNSQSTSVINAATQGFSSILRAATGPAGSGGITIPNVGGINVPQFGS